MSDIALELQTVTRTFRQGETNINVLRGVSLQVRRGELVGLVGPSGSGKSTLLQITGLLEQPTSGEVIVNGQPCAKLSDDARTTVRRNHLGFVYQYHHLLPEFSAVENVIMPQIIAGLSWGRARGRALELLGALGLEDRAEHRPARLSGGEQQRVAIARAVANAPLVLLADEPTGNLDQQNSDRVFTQLRALVGNAGIGAMVATHNLELAKRMDRILALEDGLIEPM